jgi:prepilin-type N-terminal cleavage/methylation domain-containing protein
MHKIENASSGFTLIELACVVLILGLLAVITVPNVMGFTDKSKEASVKANMHTIQLGVEDFATTHDGDYPGVADNAVLRAGMPGGDWPINPFTKNPTAVVWNADPATPGEISISKPAVESYQIKGFGEKNLLELVLQTGNL